LQTVQDQIRLWERETQRVALAGGYCYSNFEDAALFERSRAFAQQRGLLLWDSADKQMMVVTGPGAARRGRGGGSGALLGVAA
jgi:hypothetical protein